MLSSSNRLRKQKDFDRVYKKGRKQFGPMFNLQVSYNNLPDTRFAFVVSKKTSKKVNERNLVKRRLRAIVRDYIAQIKKGFDIVITVKQGALNKNYQELKDEMAVMLKKAKLIE